MQLKAPRLYPLDLLHASLERRLHYFQSEFVATHARHEEMVNEISALAAFPTSRNLILLVGPTGAGKSALLRRVNQSINKSFGSSDGSTTAGGCYYSELATPQKGSFDFTQLHYKGLQAMRVQLPELSRPYIYRETGAIDRATIFVESRTKGVSAQGIEERYITEFSRRKLALGICDEGRAIFKVPASYTDSKRLEQLKLHGDILKDLANALRGTLLIAGAYDFYELVVSSGQTARRTKILHYQAYDCGRDRDLDDFAEAVLTLVSHLPIENEVDTTQLSTELLFQSLGCIGTASGILADGLRSAFVSKKPLTIELLRQQYYPAPALRKMRDEQNHGSDAVKKFLSLEELAIPVSPREADSMEKEDAKPRKGRKLKPGDTAPTRYSTNKGAW